MNRLFKTAIALGVVIILALCAQAVKSAPACSQENGAPKVMREFKGVKLGMKRDQARSLLGKAENSTDASDDFKLTGEDSITLHYDNGEVKAIQLAFLDAKNAPAWADVVGDADVNEMANGAKSSRRVMNGENFWVSIYQNKDASITRITISR